MRKSLKLNSKIVFICRIWNGSKWTEFENVHFSCSDPAQSHAHVTSDFDKIVFRREVLPISTTNIIENWISRQRIDEAEIKIGKKRKEKDNKLFTSEQLSNWNVSFRWSERQCFHRHQQRRSVPVWGLHSLCSECTFRLKHSKPTIVYVWIERCKAIQIENKMVVLVW